MYKIGLTGGIGSGKSRVADMLMQWGAAVIDTDVIAHALTAPGGLAIEPIRQQFGPDVIAATGALDRQAMRELAFDSPQARAKLEAILHPLIRQETEARAAQATGCYLVFVVPLLVESERWADRVDRVCVVDCDPDTQVRRVQARSGLTPEAIARIMSAQASRETRLAAADDIIVNDGRTDADALARQVRALHDAWCEQAGQAGGSRQ
ncbi:dephospho-CoA kinase [Paracandidimonas lactea]|uniref:dephospho-CoA kinase n=1 Tax=Paracandidimonas lactea TaxID=2895524 RepID=UPI001EEE8006|nr:dephospho-CoA kinase [Paracandidimonas lactea]